MLLDAATSVAEAGHSGAVDEADGPPREVPPVPRVGSVWDTREAFKEQCNLHGEATRPRFGFATCERPRSPLVSCLKRLAQERLEQFWSAAFPAVLLPPPPRFQGQGCGRYWLSLCGVPFSDIVLLDEPFRLHPDRAFQADRLGEPLGRHQCLL
jgi:hypothetical protein